MALRVDGERAEGGLIGGTYLHGVPCLEATPDKDCGEGDGVAGKEHLPLAFIRMESICHKLAKLFEIVIYTKAARSLRALSSYRKPLVKQFRAKCERLAV